MQVAEAAVTAMEISTAGGVLSTGTSEGEHIVGNRVPRVTTICMKSSTAHTHSVCDADFHPNQTSCRLMCAGVEIGDAIAISTPSLGIMQRVRNAHMVFVTAAAVAPDGRALLTVRPVRHRRCFARVSEDFSTSAWQAAEQFPW